MSGRGFLAEKPLDRTTQQYDVTRFEDIAAILRNGFVTGLIVVSPLAVTLVVLRFVYGWIVGFMEPFLSVWVGEVGTVENLLGVLGLGIGLTALGVILRMGAGDVLVARFDRTMERIPLIRAIYSPTREASTALLEHRDRFERVALVEWPREGVRTVGFVTDETPQTLQSELEADEQHYDVFVPMSPNPMGGFLAIVPASKLTMTDLSVQEGLRMVVTTGLQGDSEFSLR